MSTAIVQLAYNTQAQEDKENQKDKRNGKLLTSEFFLIMLRIKC